MRPDNLAAAISGVIPSVCLDSPLCHGLPQNAMHARASARLRIAAGGLCYSGELRAEPAGVPPRTPFHCSHHRSRSLRHQCRPAMLSLRGYICLDLPADCNPCR